MRVRWQAAALLSILAIAAALFAQGKERPPAAPSANAGGAVGDEHRRLAALAGQWRVKQSLWLVAGQPPQLDTGAARFTPVLGGRHLRQDLRIESSAPFRGLGYMGYDNATGGYYASWMDTNFTGILLLQGDYNPVDKAYRLHGDMSGEGGERIPTREELHMVDSKHFVVRYYETRHGQEALVVELEYSRL